MVVAGGEGVAVEAEARIVPLDGLDRLDNAHRMAAQGQPAGSGHREQFEVGLMCRTLEVSRSGFYAWLDRGESDRDCDDRRLTALIVGIFDESRGTYGVPRVHQTLLQRGEPCGHNRVARLMLKAGLRSKTKRRFRVKTTDSKHGNPIAPDQLDQDFRASAANKVWVSDITYIPTDEG